jgi:FecR protein
MNTSNVKVWPHLTIVAVICAVVAGLGVGWWVRHESTASANAIPNAARIQRVDGDVALNNAASNSDGADANWVQATPNQPFSVGDRIYTRENSHASLAFTGRNFARLDPNSSLDVLSLSDRRTQLALRDGAAMFDVGYLAPDELFEVATPYGAVDFQQPGLYNVGINNGNVLVSVLSGLAQVAGLGGSGQISKGEALQLLGQTAADVVLSRVDGRNAGYVVDDYYSYQYPRYYDGRYRDYNVYLSDPYYFDPYRRTSSYQYVNSSIPGSYDLDYYGDWRNVNGYGYAWAPRVDSSWAPYQDGYWMTDYPYGPTWVSSEPWGYAPYHYGRWANVSNQWYWVPDNVSTAPVYSPALVAFVPYAQNEIGWVPLGPGDPYAPRYYNTDWNPYYLSRTQNIQSRLVNLYAPNAVTMVPIDDFNRDVDFRRVRHADRQMLANVNPVLDPLTLTPLRNAVIHSAWGRGKKDLPPGIAKKLNDTFVVTSSAPVAPPFRRNLARDMRVESADKRFGNRQFKVRDERGQGGVSQTAPVANSVEERTQRAESPRGNDGQSQRRIENAMQQTQAERARASQQAQGERVGRPAKQQVQREVARPASPSVRREPGNVRIERPAQPVHQPKQQMRQAQPPRAMERPGPPVRQQGPPARQQGPPQQQVRQPAPKANVNPGRPVHGQGQGQGQGQQKVEQKQGGPPAKAQPAGGGKGKGKKP